MNFSKEILLFPYHLGFGAGPSGGDRHAIDQITHDEGKKKVALFFETLHLSYKFTQLMTSFSMKNQIIETQDGGNRNRLRLKTSTWRRYVFIPYLLFLSTQSIGSLCLHSFLLFLDLSLFMISFGISHNRPATALLPSVRLPLVGQPGID